MSIAEQEPDLASELRHARSAIWTVAQMGGASTTLLMQYIGWFAPPNGKLSFGEIYQHLCAVQAMFNDSTAAQWQAALRQPENAAERPFDVGRLFGGGERSGRWAA